jgi:mannonate dehydratase
VLPVREFGSDEREIMAATEQLRVGLCDATGLSEEALTFGAQLGLYSVRTGGASLGLTETNGYWEEAELRALADRVAAHGMRLEAIENVPHGFTDQILLGLPGRDAQIANYQTTIRNMGRAGIPILGYHFMPSSVWRTPLAAGRGGAGVTAFDLALVGTATAAERRSFTNPGNVTIDAVFAHGDSTVVSADEMWANYEYFIRAVLPVAEEAGVKIALHPDDPPVQELGGIARIFCRPDDFKRAYALANGSPAWGLDLCLGCCSEMPGGAANVQEMIEFFGPKGRIFYIHFRDVQGTVPQFQECFIGEGNYNPAETMLRLKKNGFTGFVLDDHVPRMVGDVPYGFRGRAHAIGYMQALLDAIDTFAP